MMRQTAILVVSLVAALLSEQSNAFAPLGSLAKHNNHGAAMMVESATALLAYATGRSNSSKQTSSSSRSNNNDEKASFWLKDFRIASGEIIDPYAVLKVPRKADGGAIRKSYIEQSRRYHPDGARHRKFLPGSCNSIEEVRDQWERIKLAYEILKNPQMRKRYDRHEALADPGRAVRRAATEAAVQSVFGLGKGLLDVGALAVGAIKNQASATVAAVAVAAKTASYEKQQQQHSSSASSSYYNHGISDNDATDASCTATTTPPTSSSFSQQLLP